MNSVRFITVGSWYKYPTRWPSRKRAVFPAMALFLWKSRFQLHVNNSNEKATKTVGGVYTSGRHYMHCRISSQLNAFFFFFLRGVKLLNRKGNKRTLSKEIRVEANTWNSLHRQIRRIWAGQCNRGSGYTDNSPPKYWANLCPLLEKMKRTTVTLIVMNYHRKLPSGKEHLLLYLLRFQLLSRTIHERIIKKWRNSNLTCLKLIYRETLKARYIISILCSQFCRRYRCGRRGFGRPSVAGVLGHIKTLPNALRCFPWIFTNWVSTKYLYLIGDSGVREDSMYGKCTQSEKSAYGARFHHHLVSTTNRNETKALLPPTRIYSWI